MAKSHYIVYCLNLNYCLCLCSSLHCCLSLYSFLHQWCYLCLHCNLHLSHLSMHLLCCNIYLKCLTIQYLACLTMPLCLLELQTMHVLHLLLFSIFTLHLPPCVIVAQLYVSSLIFASFVAASWSTDVLENTFLYIWNGIMF